MAKRTVNNFKKYLKERQLTRSFNTWNKLKPVKKQRLEIALKNYDGTNRRSIIYAYKQNNKVIFKDFNTLKTIGTYKSDMKTAIKKLNTVSKARHKNMSFNGKPIDFEIKRSGIKLKNSNSRYSYNNAKNILREVVSTNTRKGNKVGAVVTKLELTSTNGTKFKMIIRSKFAPLTRIEIDKRIDENIRNASGKAGWSPFEIIIHDIWYEYWLDRREKLQKVTVVR